MTDLGEIRAVLAGVAEQLGSAYQQAGVARARIADAKAVLDELGEQHSEPLVPAELLQAEQELERGLGLINSGAVAVDAIQARL
ncbi:MAG TPA: hypothetical protein VKZ81_02100 [Pseudonocardia sp.]|uniref:hypothetical protein n=1 Tax=Pseudonocardia sp. TaxID=60912 RepID=UPI002B4B497F|nr:hypothetical protein [Pseudonocardia sp.]HLU54226.1 hypothetical protein [Pseudonocardia sp.]